MLSFKCVETGNPPFSIYPRKLNVSLTQIIGCLWIYIATKQFRIVLKRGYFVGGRLKNGYRFTLELDMDEHLSIFSTKRDISSLTIQDLEVCVCSCFCVLVLSLGVLPPAWSSSL